MTMKTLRLLALAAAFAAAGCISTSDFQRAQDQIAELQDELANVKRTTAGKEEVQGVNVRIAEQTETLLRSNATLVAKVAALEETMGSSQGTNETTNHRLDQLAAQLAQNQREIENLKALISAMQQQQTSAASAGPVTPGSEMTVPGTATPVGDPMETYQAVRGDIETVAADLYGAGTFDVEHVLSEKLPFEVRVIATSSLPDASSLLNRLSYATA